MRYNGSELHGQYRAFEEFKIKYHYIRFRYWANFKGNATGFIVSNILGDE